MRLRFRLAAISRLGFCRGRLWRWLFLRFLDDFNRDRFGRALLFLLPLTIGGGPSDDVVGHRRVDGSGVPEPLELA